MQQDLFEPELKALGIDRQNATVLALLPMIYVAWADGRMEAVERERILDIARTDLVLDERTGRILDTWLRTCPTPEYFSRGLTLFRKLANAPDSPETTWEDMRKAVVCAESVARADPRAMDSPWTMNAAEWQALQNIARFLGVDAGESWARVLRDLGEDPRATLDAPAAPAAPQRRVPQGAGQRRNALTERRIRAAVRANKSDPGDPSGGLV